MWCYDVVATGYICNVRLCLCVFVVKCVCVVGKLIESGKCARTPGFMDVVFRVARNRGIELLCESGVRLGGEVGCCARPPPGKLGGGEDVTATIGWLVGDYVRG